MDFYMRRNLLSWGTAGMLGAFAFLGFGGHALNESSRQPVRIVASQNTCSCEVDPNTKKVDVQNTWYGTRRAWSCEYSCVGRTHETQRIVGNHSDWYLGDPSSDIGLEGVCDGLRYESHFSPHSNREVYLLVGKEFFNPKNSHSETLRQWARLNCD